MNVLSDPSLSMEESFGDFFILMKQSGRDVVKNELFPVVLAAGEFRVLEWSIVLRAVGPVAAVGDIVVLSVRFW